jgi:hypothetical protein
MKQWLSISRSGRLRLFLPFRGGLKLTRPSTDHSTNLSQIRATTAEKQLFCAAAERSDDDAQNGCGQLSKAR